MTETRRTAAVGAHCLLVGICCATPENARSLGARDGAGLGALAGALAGALVGGMVASALPQCDAHRWMWCLKGSQPAQAIALGTLIGVASGLALGSVVGASIGHRERLTFGDAPPAGGGAGAAPEAPPCCASAKEPRSGVDLVALPGGILRGGNFDGQRVSPFALARTATTVAQLERCVAAGACTEPGSGGGCNRNRGRSDHPANCVDWSQAAAFCGWIGARLPTAAEREWAASSGRRWDYPWGIVPPGARACWGGEGNDRGVRGWEATCPVGAHPAGTSRQGLQDLAGNVWEWLADGSGGAKESRGGSWLDGDPGDLAASARRTSPPASRLAHIGFRCAQ